MNKHCFSLLCLIVIAFAPACKKTKRTTTQEKIKTTIELDNNVIEVNDAQTIVKF
jgi:hypothetical protein